jgi:hypothetical protein
LRNGPCSLQALDAKEQDRINALGKQVRAI